MKRLVRTLLIAFAMSVAGFVVRWASGQFILEFNVILFFTSLILITVSWEFLRWINIQLNKVFPFEKS